MSEIFVVGGSIQAVSDDFSTDGMLNEPAKIDHQHPLSTTLAARIGPRRSGAPTGTGSRGDHYFDVANDREYYSDGTGWIIMSEPQQAFVPNVVPSVGAITAYTAAMEYTRSNGYLEHNTGISITNNGTGAGFIALTVPVDSAEQVMGHGKEIAVIGVTLAMARQAASTALIQTYNALYPGGNGYILIIHGRYRMASRYS